MGCLYVCTYVLGVPAGASSPFSSGSPYNQIKPDSRKKGTHITKGRPGELVQGYFQFGHPHGASERHRLCHSWVTFYILMGI